MITKVNLNDVVINGVTSVLGAGSLFTTGKVWYVDSTRGNDNNIGTDPRFPKSSIGGAQTAATASVGDVVVVNAGYTETRTTALTLSKDGVSYIGLGNGMARPSITGNGTIDAVDITGANIGFENFQFPAPSIDNQTSDINVSGAGVTIKNTYHIGSQTAKNKTDIITVASGANDLKVLGVRAYNVTVDCVSFLSLEAAVARFEMAGCTVMGTFSTGVLMDEDTATLAYIHDNVLKNTKAATAVVTFTTGNSTGVMSKNMCSGRHTTIASNIVPGTGMDFFENYVVEEAALNGLYIPAQDAD